MAIPYSAKPGRYRRERISVKSLEISANVHGRYDL